MFQKEIIHVVEKVAVREKRFLRFTTGKVSINVVNLRLFHSPIAVVDIV
jgi:hypothetical protein